MAKKRLDIVLVEKGFFQSREKAKRSIMAGVVAVNSIIEDKPGAMVNDDITIDIKQKILPYVSRGGLKLEKAIELFRINLTGMIAMDVGASTGGFTDCMLKNGVSKVYAVDVGYGQLAWTLRNDKRVVNMERTNIRYIKPENIEEPLDFVSIDVAFISLKLVLPAIKNLLVHKGRIVALIKPQFEAGREKVGKHGVVREKETHYQVLKDIILFTESIGLELTDLTYSPIKGPEGNIEFLMYCSNSEISENYLLEKIQQVVDEAHDRL